MPRESEHQEIGWAKRRDENLSHYWMGRKGYGAVVSICWLVSKKLNLRADDLANHCPICDLRKDDDRQAVASLLDGPPKRRS